MLRIAFLLLLLEGGVAVAQDGASGSVLEGPTKDVTIRVVWLIESDDANRVPYSGPSRERLSSAGYDRMVVAGSATAVVTIGQQSTISGWSRYGQLTVFASLLNTTQDNELQVKINLQTKNQSPMIIDTTARVPMGRWFLLGGADSRVALPKHADDGKRAVAIMRIEDGVLLLD